jgi:hypothetical protein
MNPDDAARHPSPEALKRFLRAELERVEARAIVRHLLRGCARCGHVTCRLWGLGELPLPDRYLLAEMRKLVRKGLGGVGVL